MKYLLMICFLKLILLSSANAQESFIKGKVTDEDGAPLPGASVMLEGTVRGDVSSKSGEFLINNVPNGNYFIKCEMIGYQGETKEIRHFGDSTIMNFSLSQRTVKLNEVMVTANKYEENLQKTPIAVTAITEAEIEDTKIDKVEDLTSLAPNVFAIYSGSYRSNSFQIRGIQNPGWEFQSFYPTMGMSIDGVYQLFVEEYPVIMDDIQRIEILRGPQGTLYGRNAMAGIINIVTKQPGNIFRGSAQLEYGNYNSKRAAAGISGPILQDKLFYRINAFYYDFDGYYKNVTLDKNAGWQTSYGITAQLNYIPFKNFNLSLKLNSEKKRESVYPMAYLAEGKEITPFEIKHDIENELDHDKMISASLKAEYDLSAFKLTSITAIESSRRKSHRDGDMTEHNFGEYFLKGLGKEYMDLYNFCQEVRVESVFDDLPLKIIGGSFYYFSDPVGVGNFWINDWATEQFPDLYPYTPMLFDFYTDYKGWGLAFFGQATYTILDKIDITAGIRYDYEDFQAAGSQVMYFPEHDIDPITDYDVFYDTVYTSLTPKFSISYRHNEDITIYAAYAEGFKIGGVNASVSGIEDFFFGPEYSYNYEIGIKSQWLENKIRFNAAFFYIDWKNQQIYKVVQTHPVWVAGTENSGSSKSMGAEFELTAVPLGGFTVNSNLGYTNAYFTKYQSIDLTTQEPVYYKDNKEPFTPEINFYISGKYEYPLEIFINGNLVLNINYRYFTEIFFDPANNYRQSPYGLLGAGFGLRTKHYDINIWGKNILDEVYYGYFYDGIITTANVIFGPPRTFGVAVKYKF